MKRYSFAPVQARPFPTLHELDNPWIFGNVRSIINVSERTSEALITEYERRGIAYHHFPLSEETDDIGWANLLLAVDVLRNNILHNVPTIVHCMCGNHRSRLVVEATHYSLTGQHLEDPYKGAPNHLLYNLEHGHFPLTREAAENQLCIFKPHP